MANPYYTSHYVYREFVYNTKIMLPRHYNLGDIICYGYNCNQTQELFHFFKELYKNDGLHVETGIGYFNTYADFRAFESYHCYSYALGAQDQASPKFSDRIIPNYFDDNDFRYSPEEKEDYFVFMGRMHRHTKGSELAIQIAQKCT